MTPRLFYVARTLEGRKHRNTLILRKLRICLLDPFGSPIARAPYVLSLGGVTSKGAADEHGYLEELVTDAPERCVVRWGHPAQDHGDEPHDEMYPFELEVFLELCEHDAGEAGRRRLHNLGYEGNPALHEAVTSFQCEHAMPETGLLSDIEDELARWHENPAEARPSRKQT